MARLVDPELAAAWQTDEGQTAPILIVNRAFDGYSTVLELSQGAIDVIGEQIDILAGLPCLSRMNRELRWWKREDQPAASRVYRAKAGNIRSNSGSLL